MINLQSKLTKTVVIIYITVFITSFIIAEHNLNKKKKIQTTEVAKVICAEMCSEGSILMQGVANTIQNRMKLNNKSAYEIVTERNQYYGYTNINKDKIFKNKQCQEVAISLAENINNLIDITNGALYFRLDNESVRAWHKELTVKIKNVSFYK